MINLLPLEAKKQLRAARGNSILSKYYALLLCSILLLVAIFGIGFWVTINQEDEAKRLKQDADQASAGYQDVRVAAENFSDNLSVAKTILSADVRFSQLIADIASFIPAGVILSNLAISEQENSSALTINARSTTYDGVVNLKNQLEESPIFEDVKILNATAVAEGEGVSRDYPINAVLSVHFSKDVTSKGQVKK